MIQDGLSIHISKGVGEPTTLKDKSESHDVDLQPDQVAPEGPRLCQNISWVFAAVAANSP